MSIEVELKFIVEPTAVEALKALVAGWPVQSRETLRLSNTYYDTADGLLRRHRVGLRVRGNDGRFEMTLKSGGSHVGGVSHRAEHNVPLKSERLEIGLLPESAWSEGISASGLEGALGALFTTDFTREAWLVNEGESQIEVALDLGEVRAGEQREPICELEMELKAGRVEDVLALAKRLASATGVRLGSLSKAARGYRLSQGGAELMPEPLGLLALPARATVEQGFCAALEWALAHWQRNEASWFEGHANAQQEVRRALVAVRQAMALVGGMIPRKASSALRERLLALEERLSARHAAGDVCYGEGYLALKLELMDWMLGQRWRAFIDERDEKKLNGSFKRFADVMLSRCRAELKEAFCAPLTPDEYKDRKPRLERMIIAFWLLSGAYPDAAAGYIDAWQLLYDGAGDREAHRLRALAQPGFWLSGDGRA
ncbi:CYTH domain-containing protein [Leminorella grimontii]|uniref:CYTH domain-containing protein n=1 Tax=Leminorella grimontii TaxID=82981 RepID=UPI002089793C|nr:inorganic triphosphatase [Leminorella grimontii]GKX60839.1 CYTH domain-containing protein [Leminorella grimontii]